MSDNFIPLNQSTPVQCRQWHSGNNPNRRSFSSYQNQHNRSNRRGGGGPNRWGNNSYRNSSHGSDSNSSYGQDSKGNIDSYLHPSMLQDPWMHLRQQQNQSQTNQ